ncbi:MULTISPECIES: PD-(D/E)XK nuclease family transposase [Eisenbergiella]|uniref:PD-(D/E)XK nuclease family transposase n=1 Tax=Eisenbergiella TaxID=1432051 RepID=UPI0023F34AFF|nr:MULTISPECIES: PD-(D/E)XK nuclease family transposase [Eisenbergiella]MCI6709598.1 Rpn family recombination-promoting nuclease/putative transposase [Eisenbergiella massiliensis]MDY5525761.1 PD-(D/E)XK nuclease family transposase [Eisenbergiella porci]
MENKLKHYFPLIREREEVLKEIGENSGLQALFHNWAPDRREEFLDFCTGMKGVKILYDSFFKEIMSPEYTPDRLNRFLSLLLGKKVIIRQVLPNEGGRIADENTLLVTDILVEFEDGSLADVEIQKLGYAFPGERSACYAADLLLRQYKRARDRKSREKGKFSYKDIKDVYVIVLFEKSPVEFHTIEKEYLHQSVWSFDTGLELDLLQNFIFITLDIFQKNMENKSIENELEAWLMFCSTQDPERIIELIDKYPMFRQMYGGVYEVCRNMEKVMGMFSEELREMDRNTVQYMIDEMQATIDAQAAALEEEKKRREEEQKRHSEEQKRYEEEQKRHKEEYNKLQELIDAQAAALEKALKRIEELERKTV